MPSLYAPWNPGLDRHGRAADGHRVVALFLALVALLALNGCANQVLSPRAQLAATAEAYTAALDRAVALAREGRLTRADAEAIEPHRVIARGSLAVARDILRDPARPESDARLWIVRAQLAIDAIAAVIAKYEVAP